MRLVKLVLVFFWFVFSFFNANTRRFSPTFTNDALLVAKCNSPNLLLAPSAPLHLPTHDALILANVIPQGGLIKDYNTLALQASGLPGAFRKASVTILVRGNERGGAAEINGR